MTATAILYAASIVFSAGAFVAAMRGQKAQMNGIGQKQRKQILAAILIAQTADQKDLVAKLLLE